MSTLIKLHRKGAMTLPSQLTAAMGMSEGDYLEASLVEGKIVLAPTMVIDRSATPVANSEFSKAERRAIDAKAGEVG